MKRGWFGPRKYGFGVSPKSWQGWVVTVVAIGLLALTDGFFSRPVQEATGLPGPLVNAGFAIVWLALLLGIAALTWDDDRNEPDQK